MTVTDRSSLVNSHFVLIFLNIFLYRLNVYCSCKWNFVVIGIITLEKQWCEKIKVLEMRKYQSLVSVFQISTGYIHMLKKPLRVDKFTSFIKYFFTNMLASKRDTKLNSSTYLHNVMFFWNSLQILYCYARPVFTT